MSLKKCKECGNSLSSKANACPHCGSVNKKTSGCAMLALILIIIVVLIYIIYSFSDETENVINEPIVQSLMEWYEETGNLHKASVREWNRASHSNRLATAGDWFTAITREQNPSLQKKLDNFTKLQWFVGVKMFSEQLEICVSDMAISGEGLGFNLDDKIAEIASLCYITMYMSQKPEQQQSPVQNPQSIIAETPKLTKQEMFSLAAPYFLAGSDYFSKEEYEKAAEEFKKALEIYPGYYAAEHQLSKAAKKLNDQ
ncbi:MAG: hypothetical protein ACUZ8E_00100 [Candidatus Anammoxibacter sp.]